MGLYILFTLKTPDFQGLYPYIPSLLWGNNYIKEVMEIPASCFKESQKITIDKLLCQKILTTTYLIFYVVKKLVANFKIVNQFIIMFNFIFYDIENNYDLSSVR